MRSRRSRITIRPLAKALINSQIAIRTHTYATPFGRLSIASHNDGILSALFETSEKEMAQSLRTQFPNAKITKRADKLQRAFLSHSLSKKAEACTVSLQGTPFQLSVWRELLKIPRGSLTNYGEIAKRIGSPNASRAVGTAIGANSVALLIPCHRVILKSGGVGDYRWGSSRKKNMLAWEAKRNSFIHHLSRTILK